MSTCDASATSHRIRCRRPQACTPSVESLYDRTRRAVEKFNAPVETFYIGVGTVLAEPVVEGDAIDAEQTGGPDRLAPS